MSHKIYEVGDYSSSDAEEKNDSNSETDIVLSVRRGGSKNSKPVFTSAANNPHGDANIPKTRRAEFNNDYSDEEKEDVVHMKHGARDHSRVVAPSVPNLEAAEVVETQKAKPKVPEKKKNTSKGIHKGQSLTAGDAVEFMIKERQSLDEEFAAMRRENNQLKQDLKMKHEKTVVEKVVFDPNSEKQLADLKKLRQENSDLMKKKDEMELLLRTQRAAPAAAKKKKAVKPVSSESSSGSSESESSEPQKHVPAKKPIKLAKKSSPRAIKSTAIATKSGSPEAALPLTGKKFNSLPAVLWDGGKLWKIPYNGKGMPEERIVMIKRALRPGPQARPVRVLSKGEQARDGAVSVPVAYVAYPPAIIWYNAQKPNEAKFAREIVLVEGAYLVDGHQTPAFWKMVSRGVPMPPKELCFSIVTSTRTLDLAAETLREANTWKNAIHMLLVMMTTSKDWGVQNLRRETPTWHHDSMLKETAANNKTSIHPHPATETAPKQPNSGVMKEQMFTATKLNNFSALDDLLRSGVPVNLMEAETADTPLMVACRKNFPVVAKLCLDYGAKNDPHPDFGQTALHAAVAAGSYDCVDVLLDAAAPSGANATISNLPDPRGETPLHTAAMLGHGEIAELLISHGAQMHTPDAEGKNVIHLCAVGGHRGCLALMFDQGGDELIEARDSDGNTALHLAAEFGHLPVVRLLLETAANTSVRNNRGLTPYAIASAKGHHQVGILLLEYASGLSPAAKRSSNQSTSFADKGLGRRAISDTRAQLEQQRLRQSAFGGDDDNDGKSGGAFSLDVIEHDHSKHHPRTQLRRQNSYPLEVSSGLPRPHTFGRAGSPGMNESPRTGGQSIMSPLATSDRLIGHYDDHGGMMSARGYDSSRSLPASDEHRPMTSRERPTPALFEGLHVSKTSHAAAYHGPTDRQYSGSPGQNVVNGDRDMAEYYSYVKKNEDSYVEHDAPESYAAAHNTSRSGDFHVYPPESLRSPSPQRNSRQQYEESDENQYSYAAPLEEFESLGHRWQVFQTDEGYYYYLIEGSEHSQWDDPRTHGYQAYTEATDSTAVSASPIRNQTTPSRQGSIEEIGSPNDAFKHPKAVAGKSKPVERVKHVRALKRAPRKIELDVTPSALTPDTGGRPNRMLKSRSEYDDEDTYSSDRSITTDEFSSSQKDVLRSLRQQSSLDELRNSNKNGTDDSDGDIDGEVPEIRLVERKRASPVRLKSGFTQGPEAKQPNEYFAEVSGFVRRNLAPLDLGSDEDEESERVLPNSVSVDAENVLDVDAIPTLEDNLVVVPSPGRENNHPSPPAGPNKSSPALSTPTKKNSGSVSRMSPSVEDIKSIDSYWRQSSANQDKRTPRSRAKMALLNNNEGDLLGSNGAFETTRSAATQKTVYSDEDDAAETFRKTIDEAKREFPARTGRYGEQGDDNDADDQEWDEAKSANEGSDWDEDLHERTPLFTKKTKESDVIAALTEPEDPTEAETSATSKMNMKLAPLPKTQLSEKELLRNRQFSSDDSGYGNGGNMFESRSASTDSASENNSIVQKYLDMLYTMSARSVRALMEKNGESADVIAEFSKAAENIDIAATSVVNRGNMLKKLAASGSAGSSNAPSLGPYVSQSIG